MAVFHTFFQGVKEKAGLIVTITEKG